MKTINLTDDQFNTLFHFVNERVEDIIDRSVQFQDSEILEDWEDLFDVHTVLETVDNWSQQPLKCNPIERSIIMATTPREKTIIKLMEMVIDTLSYCEDLSDPAFSMYEVMKDAVDKEVYYPLYDK